jgi:hypothetical protein
MEKVRGLVSMFMQQRAVQTSVISGFQGGESHVSTCGIEGNGYVDTEIMVISHD